MLHKRSQCLNQINFTVHFSSFPVPRSLFPVHRSAFIVPRSSFIFHRSSFIVHRSSLTVHRSAFIVHRSPFNVYRSAFTFHRSTLTVPRNDERGTGNGERQRTGYEIRGAKNDRTGLASIFIIQIDCPRHFSVDIRSLLGVKMTKNHQNKFYATYNGLSD